MQIHPSESNPGGAYGKIAWIPNFKTAEVYPANFALLIANKLCNITAAFT